MYILFKYIYKYVCVCVCVCVYIYIYIATPWTVACQAPLSMEILQAGILEWVVMPSSRGSSQPRDQSKDPHIASRFFTI